MENDIILNDKPAVKIFATLVKSYGTNYLLDCEGDMVSFPKQCVELNAEEGTAIIEEWIYNVKFNIQSNNSNDSNYLND